MFLDREAKLQRLSPIPHLISVAAALYRCGVINGSETSAGLDHAMMRASARSFKTSELYWNSSMTAGSGRSIHHSRV